MAESVGRQCGGAHTVQSGELAISEFLAFCGRRLDVGEPDQAQDSFLEFRSTRGTVMAGLLAPRRL